MLEIITANELLSGAVIYLDDKGEWQQDINQAWRFAKDEAEVRDGLIAEAKKNNRIVGIEIEEVEVTGDGVHAQRLRERIRANGPTAPYGPERQTLETF